MEASIDHAEAALAAARGAGLAVDRDVREALLRAVDRALEKLGAAPQRIIHGAGAAHLAATGRGDVTGHLAWLGVSAA